jgi:hypothetical protein
LARRCASLSCHETVGDGVGDHAGQQGDRADGVVVARDLVVDLVGVTVGVEDRDDRQAELAASSTARCSFLVSTIQTAEGTLAIVADAAERLLELVLLALEDEQLLLGVAAGRPRRRSRSPRAP